MPLRKQSKKPEELIQIWVPKNKMRRPFPLRWGIAAIVLFFGFAVSTQLQFNKFNNQKLDAANQKTFEVAIAAYDTAVKANADCLASIKTRETYKAIFDGVSSLFKKTADLPVQLFPMSPEAIAYQQSLTEGIQNYISKPVEDGLPPKKASDCPQIPTKKPVKPKRS